LAFTITTSGTSATVVGTNSSDSLAATQLASIATVSLTAFDADDVVVLGTTNISASSLSLGQGDDQVTQGAGATISGNSLIDLGEGSDTFTSTAANISSSTIKGLGGLDTINLQQAQTLTSIFVNGNAAADRINIGNATATVVTSSTIVGGSEDDRITFNTTQNVTGGRVNGQDGDDTITVTQLGTTSTTSMYGGQGNDTLTANGWAAGAAGYVIFSGDLGNDTLVGAQQTVQTTGGDQLFGGAGNDAITGRRGMDTLIGGDGVDTFTVANGDGFNVVVTNGGVAGIVDAGDTFALNTTQGTGSANNFLLNITDFVGGGAGDILDTANGTAALNATGVAITEATGSIGVNTVTYKIAGTYNSANSRFTVTADNLGTDTLIVMNGGAASGIGNATSYLLLKGTSASTLTAANFV